MLYFHTKQSFSQTLNKLKTLSFLTLLRQFSESFSQVSPTSCGGIGASFTFFNAFSRHSAITLPFAPLCKSTRFFNCFLYPLFLRHTVKYKTKRKELQPHRHQHIHVILAILKHHRIFRIYKFHYHSTFCVVNELLEILTIKCYTHFTLHIFC